MEGRPALLARLLLMLGAETVCCRAGVPDFTRHPLAYRSQGAPADIWAPPGSPPGSPGFAAIRGFNMDGCDDKYAGPGSGPCGPAACARPGANCSAPIPAWNKMIDQMFNATNNGGLDLANCVWPGYSVVFSEYFPDLAQLLVARKAPAVDLGGFVPGGRQDFDVHAGVPSRAFLQDGMALMGDTYMGLDMGEQDVRYLWGYAGNTVLAGPGDHFEQYLSFRDYSWQIEWQSGGRLASLSSTVYAHYWLKTGLYTTAGAETSQSNGNAQMLYSFIRGAGKSYGVPWYGQVSIFNWFGYKIPGDKSPTHPPGPNQCIDQSSHSATCGTSLSLMKRLMYTQLLYDSCYFAFEGGWTYAQGDGGITPIGTLQQQAKKFFSSSSSPKLGTHVSTTAIMLDFFAGWTRPCDSKHGGYAAVAWGNLAWDGADYLADAVFDMAFPGYRGGAMNHDESYYLSPTPYGDSIDTVLSDSLPSVLREYHTLVVAHRMTSEPEEAARKLLDFVLEGGHLVITASSVLDMGGTFAGVRIGACSAVPSGATFTVGNAPSIAEPMPLSLCQVHNAPNNMTVLAKMHYLTTTQPAAVRITAPGGGSVLVLAHGNYAMSTTAKTNDIFKCQIDDDPHADRQPYQLARVARSLIDQTLRNAALFDLGLNLTWVPKRVSDSEYIIGISNNYLKQLPLDISKTKLGRITRVEEIPLDQSEKGAIGYLPHGFEHADLGNSTNTTIAGVDMRIFRVLLDKDELFPIRRFGLPAQAAPSTAIAAARNTARSVISAPNATALRVLLRLSAHIGSIRTEIERRPSFFNYFRGVVVDSEYFSSRSLRALEIENRWLELQGVEVVCDFTRSTNLFPGLRLIDDMHLYFNKSMEVISDVLRKLPALRSQHAMLTLHGPSELAPLGPCANSAASEAGTNFTNCFRQTLQRLTAEATTLSAGGATSITLHLRHSQRNAKVLGNGFAAQAAFAASVNDSVFFKFAPSTGPAAPTDTTAITSLFRSGGSDLLLLSAPWGSRGTSAPLSQVPPSLQELVRAAVDAADAAGAMMVLDAGFTQDSSASSGGVSSLELGDAHYLRSVLSRESTE